MVAVAIIVWANIGAGLLACALLMPLAFPVALGVVAGIVYTGWRNE